MMLSSRPSSVCCRIAGRMLSSRPSSSSASSEEQVARTASAKSWKVRRRVVKAAVFGNAEAEGRMRSDPGSSAPSSSYLQQGFRPTPARGEPRLPERSPRLSVDEQKRQQQQKEADQHRFYVQRTNFRKREARRSSISRSFSTSAFDLFQDDRLGPHTTPILAPSHSSKGKGPAIATPPYSSDDLADDQLDALDALELEGSSKASERVTGPSSSSVIPQFGSLVPGCWIESRRNGIALEGILCGRNPVDPREILVLSPAANGESALLGVAIDDVTFVLPSFTTPAEARQCLTLPPGHPTIHSLLQRLRHLEIRVEEHTQRLLNRGAKDLYRRINPVGSKRVRTSTSQALNMLRISGSAVESHLAMHRLLIKDPLRFIADPVSMRTTGYFVLRSTKELETFERVRGWMRDYSSELQTFAETATRFRLFSADNQPTLKTEGSPTTHFLRHLDAPPGLTWSETDLEILLFLRRTLLNERALQVHPYMSIAPSIVKVVDEATLKQGGKLSYTGLDVGRLRIRAFLSEVGVVAPWENWVVHDDSFFNSFGTIGKLLYRSSRVDQQRGDQALPSEAEREAEVEATIEDASSAAAAEKVRAVAKLEKASNPVDASSHRRLKRRSAMPQLPAQPDYYAPDPFDSTRHDFDQLAVYTIDDAGAMELDDGISIEPASASSSAATWWVHVHVADPTAVLDPAHPLARAAKTRDHTEYFPEKTWSMLPDWFIEERKMSLGSLGKAPQKTLSISMRVDETGQVLESDVRVAMVRNVKRLTYNTVNKMLGAPARPAPLVLTHPLLPAAFDPATLSHASLQRQTDDNEVMFDLSARDELATLRRLASAMLQRRANDNALYWNFPSASVSVTPKLEPHFAIPPRPTFYQDSPLVSLSLPSPPDEGHSALSPAQLLVSEMMVAANRAAAKFSVERGLPAPFRTQPAPTVSPSVLQEVLASRDPATGEASGVDILRLGVDFLPGSTSAEPGPHWPMGISDNFGYLKVTSPLRRYADLFTHWQLKSALLPSSSAPRFTRSAVVQHIEGFDLAHKARGRLSKHAEHYWALHVLKHKHDALRSDLPSADVDPIASLLLRDKPLSAISLREPTFSTVDGIWVQPVLIQELGVKATLHTDKQAEAPGKGDVLSVGVEDIKLGPRSKMIVRKSW